MPFWFPFITCSNHFSKFKIISNKASNSPPCLFLYSKLTCPIQNHQTRLYTIMLQMVISSSFQLRFMHRLKHCILGILRFAPYPTITKKKTHQREFKIRFKLMIITSSLSHFLSWFHSCFKPFSTWLHIFLPSPWPLLLISYTHTVLIMPLHEFSSPFTCLKSLSLNDRSLSSYLSWR